MDTKFWAFGIIIRLLLLHSLEFKLEFLLWQGIMPVSILKHRGHNGNNDRWAGWQR